MSELSSEDEACACDYTVRVEADELLVDIAEKAANHGKRMAEYRRYDIEEGFVPGRPPGQLSWYARQALEEKKAVRAYGTAIAMLQPGWHDARVPSGEFVAGDGTVNVREYMREISRLGDAAHDRGAREAESAYAKVTSLLRNEYGVGWPRLDDLGGNPLQEDLP